LIKNPFLFNFSELSHRWQDLDRLSFFIQFFLEVGLLPRTLPKCSIKLHQWNQICDAILWQARFLFAGERLNPGPDSDNLGNQFSALIWVRFSPGNTAAVIIFLKFSRFRFFEKRFKHLNALLGHCETDFKSVSRTGPLKTPIIDLTTGNLFDEFISVHP
jgi:hypothetical protein